jgi:hypothetical protein
MKFLHLKIDVVLADDTRVKVANPMIALAVQKLVFATMRDATEGPLPAVQVTVQPQSTTQPEEPT